MESKELPDIQSFITKIEEQFDDLAHGTLQGNTIFRELQQWDSLQALGIVSCLNWNYGITIPAGEFRNARSIDDLFQLVLLKMQE
jgi:acyl carrier protein